MIHRVCATVPGKTFLVGEYLAVVGGPSLLLATSPRFDAAFEREPGASGFHPESPAGRFWTARELGRAWRGRWRDPYSGRGGLGASTAQFACAWALAEPDALRDWPRLLAAYRQHAWDGRGAPPSGADLQAQIEGGLCVVQDGAPRRAPWPFPEIKLSLFRTGAKLATHAHLAQAAAAEWPIDRLRAICGEALAAVASADADRFARALQDYGDALARADLCADRTRRLLDDARSALGPALVAAKGCGAMGADVALLAHAPGASRAVAAWAERAGLEALGGSDDADDGLRTNEIINEKSL